MEWSKILFEFIAVISMLWFVIVVPLLLFRNSWVLRKRLDLLNRDINEYKKLSSYDSMVYKIWIWDINRFKIK